MNFPTLDKTKKKILVKMNNICVFEGRDPYHLMFNIFIFKFMDKMKIYPQNNNFGSFWNSCIPYMDISSLLFSCSTFLH